MFKVIRKLGGFSGRGRMTMLGAMVVVAGLVLAACGSSDKTTTGSAGKASTSAGSSGAPKLIIYEAAFPCGLNDYTTDLCKGITDAGEAAGPGYKVEIKNGVNYRDATAFNNLIKTSLQLKPAGLIVFAIGPVQDTILKQACQQGVKIINVDVPEPGLGDCQTAYIAANNRQLGVDDGKWLIAHPPKTKEVGVVNFPPGQYPSSDDRVKGFTDTVKDAGYKVVATVSTDLSLDSTRTGVTNMLTAHPNLGVVFSANSIIHNGVRQALKGKKDITQITIDGVLSDIPHILNGTIAAESAQAPYLEGKLAVEYMIKAIEGKKVPKVTYTPSMVVDKTNAEEFKAKGGLR